MSFERALRGSFILLIALFLWGHALAAGITNEDCMGCHEEKGLTKQGPGGKTISLFFDKESFGKSVHGSLQCVGCHDVKELPHPEKVKVSSCDTCHEDVYGQYRLSVHGGGHGAGKGRNASCKDCHGYHTVGTARGLTASICANCHGAQYREYRESVHALNGKEAKEPACQGCHGKTHDMLAKTDLRSPVNVSNLPGMCSRCHADQGFVTRYNATAKTAGMPYMYNIHGQAVTTPGVLVSAACPNCHGAHAIKPHTDPTSPIYPANIATTCGKCHEKERKAYTISTHGQQLKIGNTLAPQCATCHPQHEIQRVKAKTWMLDAIKECGNCHRRPLETYHYSYHGKITNLGFTRVAKCADCHGAHEILPRSDPRSRISEKNLVETCRECHPRANKRFAAFVVHADYRNKAENPAFYYVWLFMTGLLVAVFGFFGIHSLLWFPRSWIERFKERRRRKGE